MKESENKTLIKKLVEIRKTLGRVEKTKRNPHFGYDYVSLEHLNALLEPPLSERNIFFATDVVHQQNHIGDGKAGVFSSVTTKHTFHDGDTNETLVLKSTGLGWDTGDKAPAKAITASLKSFLKANFMISDEADDPEADAKEPAAAAKSKHTRTRDYESETGDSDQKVAIDLLELKAFLTEQKIPDAFLLRMLQDKKLIDGHTKNVAQIKPGILRRCLSEKSKTNLITAHKQFVADADADSGSATAPVDPDWPDAPPPKKKAEPDSPFDAGEPVRTSEGDQRTRGDSGRRTPAVDVLPRDILDQEGIDNWREVKIHFGKQSGTPLGKLTAKSLSWWIDTWTPKPFKGTWEEKTLLLDAALCLASEELTHD